MGKLLELIKEYWVETFDDKKLSKIEYEEKSGTFYWKYQPLPGMKLQQGQILHRTTVLSKDFGFVEWLVKNEKIRPLRKFIGWETDEDEPYIQFDLVDQYIAYLSIQDKPIEDLISYLK